LIEEFQLDAFPGSCVHNIFSNTWLAMSKYWHSST